MLNTADDHVSNTHTYTHTLRLHQLLLAAVRQSADHQPTTELSESSTNPKAPTPSANQRAGISVTGGSTPLLSSSPSSPPCFL